MDKFHKVDLAFDFLVSKENSQELFTIQELAGATGWTIPTCKTYPVKKWNRYVSRDGEHYTSSGIKYLSKEDFRNIHSQKNVETVKSERSLNLKKAREGANKQVISSQADSLIKISRIWADFFPANTSNQPI